MNQTPWLRIGLTMAAAALASAQAAPPAKVNLFGDETAPEIADDQPNAPDAASTPADPQILTFQDRSQIHGELVTITQEEVVWRRAGVSEALRIPRQEVRRLVLTPNSNSMIGLMARPTMPRLNRPKKEVADEAVPATIKLAGGDWLFGNVKSADGKSFNVQQGNGPVFTVPRSAIAWLHFESTPMQPFGCAETPLDLDSWVPAAATRTLTDGVVTFSGSDWIGHATSLPSRFEIDFTLPANGGEFPTILWLQPFGPRPNAFGTGTMQLSFAKKQFSYCYFTNKFERHSTPLPGDAARDTAPASYRVFVDTDAQRLAVQRNGVALGDWQPQDAPAAPNGQPAVFVRGIRGICFQRRAPSPASLELQGVAVRPWNGVVPKQGEPATVQDRLELDDVPSVDGTLEAISDDHLQFAGASVARGTGVNVHFSPAPAVVAAADFQMELGPAGAFSGRQLVAHDGKVFCETAFSHTLEVAVKDVHAILLPQQKPADREAADLLVFKNGDELHGHILTAASHGPVHWKSTSGQELTLAPDEIAGFRLASSPGSADSSPRATLEMRNGDRLHGTILGLDGKQLRVQNDKFGTITLDRDALWHVYPNSKYGITDGGVAPEEWMGQVSSIGASAAGKTSPGKPTWIHLDGRYVQHSEPGGGNFNINEMPVLEHPVNPALDRFEIRFEVWAPGSQFGLFSFSLLNKDNGPALIANLSPGTLYVAVRNPQRQRFIQRNANIQENTPASRERKSVRIFVDKKTGTCDWFFNGVSIVHLGHDPSERLSESQYTARLQLYPGVTAANVVSNLWIGPWNGELPRSVAPGGPALSLVNGDVAFGNPKSIQNGTWSVEGDVGPLDIPTERVLAADFGGELQPRRSAARLWLVDGTVLTVDDFQWKERELTAHSATVGELRLPLGAIAELIYDPALPHAPMTPESKDLAQKAAPEPVPNK